MKGASLRIALCCILAATALSPDGAIGGERGPRTDAGCPPDAVPVTPGQSIQAAATAAGPDRSICIKAGIHRGESIRPLAGQSFHGEPGAVLSGARPVTGFHADGRHWSALHPLGSDDPHGACKPDHPLCKFPIQVFLSGEPLRRVASRAALGAGLVYLDKAAGRVVLGEDPKGRDVEITTNVFAFRSDAPAVRVNNLVVEKFKSPAQGGAIDGRTGTRWTVENVEARFNSGAGVTLGNGGRIVASRLHHNGQIGAVLVGANLVLADTELADNNTLGFDPGWEAGAIKIALAEKAEIRGNHVHHNRGPGLWCDIDCRDVIYENNLSEHNDGPGIFHEISYAAVIRNNVVRNNGRRGRIWYWNSDIQISASEDVEVTGNEITVSDGGCAVALIDQNVSKDKGGKYKTRRNRIHHNTVVFEGSGEAGGVSDAKAGDENFGIIEDGANRFDFNTYRAKGKTAAPRFVWGRRVLDWDGFRKTGQERQGSLFVD